MIGQHLIHLVDEAGYLTADLAEVAATLGASLEAVQAVLVAKDGWKCNDAYPYKFKVGSSPEGVSFASDTARGASVRRRAGGRCARSS